MSRFSIVGLGVVCVVALVVAVAGAGAASKPRTTVVLGSTANLPDPSCPELPCQAVGSVTGFQVSTNQGSLPFRVPRAGKVKAWTLTLAQPTNKQRSFFNGFFGTPPEARLAILRRIPGTSPPRYNLRGQSSVHVLSPYLGQTVKFGSNLRVQGRRHRRPHDPDLGPGLRPEPLGAKRLARQPRTGQMHQHHRRPPRPAPGQDRQASNLRLPLLHGPPALHRHGSPRLTSKSDGGSPPRTCEPVRQFGPRQGTVGGFAEGNPRRSPMRPKAALPA